LDYIAGCQHRQKLCEFHRKAWSIVRNGQLLRYCQHCCSCHVLDKFDGTQRHALLYTHREQFRT